MLNPWLAFSLQVARLAWETQNMMAFRLLRLAGGGAVDQSEAHCMVSKKRPRSTKDRRKCGRGSRVALAATVRKKSRASTKSGLAGTSESSPNERASGLVCRLSDPSPQGSCAKKPSRTSAHFLA